MGPPLSDERGQVVSRPPGKPGPGNASGIFGWPIGGPGLSADCVDVRDFRVNFTHDIYMEVMVLTLEDALNYVRFCELPVVFGSSADADLVDDCVC